MKESNTSEVILSNLQTTNKRLTFFFRLIFIILTLVIASLVIFLTWDISSESNHLISEIQLDRFNPTTDLQKNLFLSLQIAADQLENITRNKADLGSCWGPLHRGLNQLNYILENREISQKKREMTQRIATVEMEMEKCLQGLQEMGLREKVDEAYESVRSAGSIYGMMEMHVMDMGKFQIWHMVELIGENIFLVCVVLLQFSFLGFMFWIVYKFR